MSHLGNLVEVSSTSTVSFDDAIRTGLARASRQYADIRGAWVKDQQMDFADGRVTRFRVSMQVDCGHLVDC